MRLAALTSAILLAACGPPQDRASLVVAAAASVRAPAEEIVRRFESDTGIHVDITGGATGALAAQARQGAPFDVFLAADDETPRALAGEGVLDRTTVHPYARGRLVIWSSAGVVAVDDLREAEWASRRIAIASPLTAPYGRAAMRFLACAGLDESLGDALIPAGDVRSAYEIAATGNADIALVPESVVAPGTPFSVATCNGDSVAVDHALGVMASSKHAGEARRLAEFFVSPQAQAIFAAHRLEPAEAAAP